MRKQTKLAVVLSAAALLAIGASMTSFAKGWTQEDGEWVYLDSDGERVTGEWKSSNGNYYWLDDDGWMARNELVDDGSYVYYVNEDGVRIKNQWKSVENEDDDEVNGQECDVLWYYFGDNGRAYYADSTELKKKTIGGKYYFFDSEGRMAFDWIEYDGDTYYCGDENQGWAFTGWQYLEPSEDLASGDYDDQEWFLFKSSGKMRHDTTYYTGGRYYTFDSNGVCQDDWLVYYASTPVETDGTQYASINGSKGTGWIYEDAPDEADTYWYYLVTVKDADGTTRSVAFNSYADDGYRAKVVKGKTYLFNDNSKYGAMEDGLVTLEGRYPDKDGKEDMYYTKYNETIDAAGIACKPMPAGIYYFNDSVSSTAAQRGQMATGKTSVTDDGETNYYYFNKSTGAAYTNMLIDGVLYGPDGMRVQADDGNSNSLYTVDETVTNTAGAEKIKAGTTVVVSSTGKVRTSGSVKVDGVYYKIDSKTYEATYDENKN